MFGYNIQSKYISILNRNLELVPEGLSKERIKEYHKFLCDFMIQEDPQNAIGKLLHTLQLNPNEAIRSSASSDLEVLFYLKLVTSAADNSNPAPTALYLSKLKEVMELKLKGGYSKDPIVRKAQEILSCENIKHFMDAMSVTEKQGVAELLSFFVEVTRESGDSEFWSSISIIVQFLRLPNSNLQN